MRFWIVLPLAVLAVACDSSPAVTPAGVPPGSPADAGAAAAAPAPEAGAAGKTDADYKVAAVQGIHDSYAADIGNLVTNAKALQAAAPTPTGRGWDATLDAAVITTMKDKWRGCRIAWEHIEGAVAPIVPDIDISIDARYEDFLGIIGPAGDQNLFDDKGVIGMHAVERILYTPGPQRAIDFEKQLQGYKVAAFPATEQEASDFKTKLLQKLVDDVTLLQSQWQPAKIDPGVAWGGLVTQMNAQREKVNNAATGQEESRYADMTLFDLRNNLDGTKKAYAAFQPWLTARPAADSTKDGEAADQAITEGFAALDALYSSYTGDGIPEPPPTWSALHPSDADLQTPFGKLFSTVTKAVDPNTDGSVVSAMNLAASVFGFAPFKQGG